MLENYLPHKDEISIYLQTKFRMKGKFFGQLQRFIAEKQNKKTRIFDAYGIRASKQLHAEVKMNNLKSL